MMMKPISFQIHPFDNQTHREQVAALWQTVFGYTAARNDPFFAIDQKVAHGDGLFWAAVHGDTVLGTVMAGYDGHRGWIYSMAVLPEYRKMGIGQSLLSHAETQLVSQGCVKVNLQILKENHGVQAFYRACGYTPEDRISMGKVFRTVNPNPDKPEIINDNHQITNKS